MAPQRAPRSKPRSASAAAAPRGGGSARLRYARVVVAGATGLVGRALLSRLVSDPQITSALALIRDPDQANSLPGGVTPQVVDFQQLGQAEGPALPAVDWAFCCLGTTIRQAGSQAAFRAVDFDAALAFARAAQAAGARRLAVVSSTGADAASAVFYNRVKGELEQALQALALPRLVIARPSLLLGNRSALGQPLRVAEFAAQALMPAFGWLLPRRLLPIAADTVALAMLRALQQDSPAHQVLESDALQALGRDES